jgi:hypothetical protein
LLESASSRPAVKTSTIPVRRVFAVRMKSGMRRGSEDLLNPELAFLVNPDKGVIAGGEAMKFGGWSAGKIGVRI